MGVNLFQYKTHVTLMEFWSAKNLRGGKERIFDDMNNGFGWARLSDRWRSELQK